jgi:hypothetical protein
MASSGEGRDSSVGIALAYGLDDLGSMVRFLAGAENVSGAHPASYPVVTGALSWG